QACWPGWAIRSSVSWSRPSGTCTRRFCRSSTSPWPPTWNRPHERTGSCFRPRNPGTPRPSGPRSPLTTSRSCGRSTREVPRTTDGAETDEDVDTEEDGDPMEVVIADEHRLAQLAADAIERLLRTKTAPVLGLATGSSPLRIYDELAARHERQGLSFAHAQAFMLDEYVGIAADHPERYRNVIDTEIATRVDFAEEAVHGPDGSAEDLAAASAG